jgi:hypothetical protein
MATESFNLRADNAQLYCRMQCQHINAMYEQYKANHAVQLTRTEFLRDVYIPLGYAHKFADDWDALCNSLLDSGLEAEVLINDGRRAD